jgi:mRNA-degrading endonuclease toxin of MazEF toxin-antitoxin module
MGDEFFDEWNDEKQRIDGKTSHPPFVSVGDIWWISIGKNVGTEINGKSNRYTRPAVILRKLKHDFYLIAPTTSQSKHGSWYVSVRHGNTTMSVCLHQIRTIDYRRVWSRIGTLADDETRKVNEGFRALYW